MTRPRTHAMLALAASLALAACDDRSGGPTRDAGGPPGADAGPSAPPSTDAGTTDPPGTDATSDSPGADAGTTDPPGADAGTSDPPDGGPGESTSGADPRAGYVGCGETSCAAPQVCCVSLSGQTCTADTGCSGSFSAAGHCDGVEDCDGGESCCVHFGMFDPDNGASCRSGGCPSGDSELCHSDADCTGSATCVRCEPPTGGVLDVVYGICSRDGRCPSPYTMAP
ncbi:MAG TPA: hypothetical protein RMH99_33270 [Sandaracinaceae bacterium LLY-WYZ-13_1]|nr:hypothetical protein [Sandaracinaceae bacterium LLY-WYZ-13_1]